MYMLSSILDTVKKNNKREITYEGVFQIQARETQK